MRRLAIVLTCFMVLAASSVRADWQYTKWGMTPQQVVAASGGAAELIPAGKRPRLPPLETAASGNFKDGELDLRTVFSFDTSSGGLACVFYGLTAHDGDDVLKGILIKRFGPPQSTSGLPPIGMQTLGWKTATDDIDASFSKDDPAYVMHCARPKINSCDCCILSCAPSSGNCQQRECSTAEGGEDG